MTEVDYSPEAYQRYMATRARVGNWAVEASSYSAHYTHPFQSHQPTYSPTAFGPVPEVRPSDSISLYNAPRSDDRRGRDRTRAREADRPTHARSKSTPHASTSHPVSTRHMPPPAQLPFHVERQTVRPRNDPVTYKTIDLRKYPEYIRNGEVKLPPLRPGETYMLIPPKGKRVEVVNASTGGPQAYRLHPSSSAATSPTRHASASTRYVSQTQAQPASSPYMQSSRAAARATSPPPVAYAAQGGYGYVQQQVYVPYPPKPYQGSPVPVAAHVVPRAKSPVKKPLLKRLLTGAGDKPRSGRRQSD